MQNCSLPYLFFPKHWRSTTFLPGKILASAKAETHQGWRAAPYSITREKSSGPWLCLNRAPGRGVGVTGGGCPAFLRWSRGSRRSMLSELGKLYFWAPSFWFLRAFSLLMGMRDAAFLTMATEATKKETFQ